MANTLANLTGVASVDAFGGPQLQQQQQDETDEEKKKRLKLLQQNAGGITTTGPGSAFGSLGVQSLFGNYGR